MVGGRKVARRNDTEHWVDFCEYEDAPTRAAVFFGVLAYPERGAGDDGPGVNFGNALVEYSRWAAWKQYGRSALRSHGIETQPRESWEGILRRGSFRIRRRLGPSKATPLACGYGERGRGRCCLWTLRPGTRGGSKQAASTVQKPPPSRTRSRFGGAVMRKGDTGQQIGAMQFMARDFVAQCLKAGFDPVAIGGVLITAGAATIKQATDENTATETIGRLHRTLLLAGLGTDGKQH